MYIHTHTHTDALKKTIFLKYIDLFNLHFAMSFPDSIICTHTDLWGALQMLPTSNKTLGNSFSRLICSWVTSFSTDVSYWLLVIVILQSSAIPYVGILSLLLTYLKVSKWHQGLKSDIFYWSENPDLTVVFFFSPIGGIFCNSSQLKNIKFLLWFIRIFNKLTHL